MSDLEIKAGKDYALKLIYKDSDGIVIDITGASARMMVRRSMYATVDITKTATIDGPLGEIVFDFVPADTTSLLSNINEENYVYDVELSLADTRKFIILTGELVIKQSVTRD
jgi:hypothetical protein